jgi:hypothetical protein
MTDTEAVIWEIKDAIETVCKEHNSGEGLTDAAWTAGIKREIGERGKSKDCHVCGAGLQDGGEFLYDLCWLQYDKGGYLLRAPLVLECEWGNGDDIHDDFQKLQLASADLRVMIFSARMEREMANTMDMLKTSVEKFTGNTASGDYLLCCWCSENRAFEYTHIRG